MMNPADYEVLNVDNPSKLLMSHVPVPPVCIRPSVHMGDAGTNEDDITFQVGEIIFINNNLKERIKDGAQMRNVAELWFMLQQLCWQLVDSSVAASQTQSKPIRSICTRLKGKEGRFRGNLSGKRVDFSGRTVISPDPNIEITEICVPEYQAKKMTYPEKVCKSNIDRLKSLVRRGADQHPGANYVLQKGIRKFIGALTKPWRKVVADSLNVGDTVERHMMDGDIVLFNRQPSLHRMSIMAHRARVMPWRTLRFNECVCGPYNADFDGDEMNLHLPQTEEARAEAIQLMGVQQNIITPKDGELVIAATQDFLTASFLITQKDVFFTKDKFCQVCSFFTASTEQIDLPPPSIVKPVELWTGKQVFSVLLRPNRASRNIMVNLELEERNYTKSGETMCKGDGYVLFRNSELLAGNLGKKTLGGSKNGLFFRLIRDNSSNDAVVCMGRVAKLAARYLGDKGFTMGIDDVLPTDVVTKIKTGIMKEKYALIDTYITEYQAGRLQSKAGCSAEQTLEALTNSQLGEVRALTGTRCESGLPRFNKPRVMATCGSKGSTLNLCQMMACLGQQNVGGQRIQDGFVNRTLPHFQKLSKEPKARGFVANSFYTGLEPTEFFFHTMGGREGLVDTAVKTAETGYMARRMMKALEDVSFKYDNSARTSEGTIVQFVYGDDALNPQMMEGKNQPLDLTHTFQHLVSVLRTPNERITAKKEAIEAAEEMAKARAKHADFRDEDVEEEFAAQDDILTPFEMIKMTREMLGKHVQPHALKGNQYFADSILKFITEKAEALASRREVLGMPKGDTKQKDGEDAADKTLFLEDVGLALRRYQLRKFIITAGLKYRRARTEPGEAVGAIAAQSISEPATQMTLKTFHFAGVASMNVTLGVPRIKEIINAAKTISTPIISAPLENPWEEMHARYVKGRIERTVLGDIMSYVKEVYQPSGVWLTIKIDVRTISMLNLDVRIEDIRNAILEMGALPRALKLKPDCVRLVGSWKLAITPPTQSREKLLFDLQALKKILPSVVVWGTKSIGRVVVNKDDKEMRGRQPKLALFAEGYGLQDVMIVPGVVGTKCCTNHIEELKNVLGIEAARLKIMDEVRGVMSNYGIGVDARHVMLLGDCMTYRGDVLGINRFGIAKMRTSTLMLASFERTTDHLFDAAVHSREDPIDGVSECIIMGTNVRLGTGLFNLLYKVQPIKKESRPPLMQFYNKRVKAVANQSQSAKKMRLA